MARIAVIRIADQFVVNVITLDPGSPWTPPAGHETRDGTGASVGDTWNGLAYITPPYVPTPDEVEDTVTMPPIITAAIAFRDRTDYLPEPSLANLPVLSATANAAQTRDYIIANVIPRLNVLSSAINTAAPRINVNTKASQGIIKVVLYIGKRLMGIGSGD